MELKARIDAEFLPFVSKPARYLGNEYNAVLKSPQPEQLRVALCFSDLYEAGIRNTAFETLYHCLNSLPNISAERVYTPGTDAEAILRAAAIPLFSVESKFSLNEFDLLVFYFPDVFSFTNLLTMLHLGGIPPRARERNAGEPPVIGVGPALINPEPPAAFLDAAVPGNPAVALWEIAAAAGRAKSDRRDGQEFLRAIAAIPGVYVPSFYEPVYNDFKEFQGISRLEPSAPERIRNAAAGSGAKDEKICPLKPLLPPGDLPNNRPAAGLYERFTGENNRFAPGRVFPPAVQQSAENLYRELQKCLQGSGAEPAARLLSNDALFRETGWGFAKEKCLAEEHLLSISLPSTELTLRLPAAGELANALKENGFALTPLAGGPRLRSVLNLNLRDQDILDAARLALENGWQTIRLNFMLGLPAEKPEEIAAIAALAKKCLEIVKSYPEAQLLVSAQGFSPKPHTPFQWEKQESAALLEEKFEQLRQSLADLPVKTVFQNPRLASLETALSRGDRRTGEVIESAWRRGARLDAYKETFRGEAWERAFREKEIDWEACLAPISVTVALPWDHIDLGASKADLKEEKLRAYQGQLHPRNKDMVSLGYGGLPRTEFEALLRGNLPAERGSAGKGAVSPPQSAAMGGPQGEAMQYGRRERKRQAPVQVIKRKIRIRYSKSGPARFLSHLDIVRVFDFSARLAKIPLVYSQGLRPNPKISYALPLSPGVASTAEYLDMEVEIGRETDIQGRFNQFLPGGIQILQYQGIFAKVPALAAVINRSTYEALLADFTLPEEWLAEWLAQPEVQIRRETKEGMKEVDIRPYVRQLTRTQSNLNVTIDIIEGRTAKITEVLESLLSPRGIEYRKFQVQRTGQYIVENDSILTPFDII